MSNFYWRCYHCDATFKRRQDAAEHFGNTNTRTPACQIKAYEGHLVTYIRKLEAQLDRYRTDDSDIMRAIMAMEVDHRQALIRAEQGGYDKGVRDARNEKDEAA